MEYRVTAAGLAKELFVIAQDADAPFAAGDDVAVTLGHSGVALVPRRRPILD